MAYSYNLKSLGDTIGNPYLRKRVQPLPYGAYVCTVIAICLIGIFLSAYLAISHYRIHTDIGYQSFCALSKAINCDTVAISSYSVVWGLPVAVWGIAGYSFFMVLVGLASLNPKGFRQSWAIVLLTALMFSLVSLILACISAFKIGSYCIICIATYAINFFLVYIVWIIRRRHAAQSFLPSLRRDLFFLWSKRKLSLPVILGFATGLIFIRLSFPVYWDSQQPTPSIRVKSGFTSEGHPWIGGDDPSVEIIEFSDYQCFQCKKMHRYLRELVSRNPEKIRLIHRNYPMDHKFNPIVTEPFHVGSGQMALIAIHAAATGKFFEVNDLLFSLVANSQNIRFAEIAEKTGMDPRLLSAALQHKPYQQQLLRDIRDGMKLGIVGTPSYVVNGRVYEGSIPVEVLKPLLNATYINRGD